MILKVDEEYLVLGEQVDKIIVGNYNEETELYTECILVSDSKGELARYRYYTRETIPKHTIIE
jgi:hypothetical protein